MISDKSISILIKRALIILSILFLPLPCVNGQGRSGSRNPVVPGETISPQVSGIRLEVLFDGIADLFYYSDKDTEHYLLTDENGRVYTLNIPRQVMRSDSETGSSPYTGVLSVLKLFMADAPEFQDRINDMIPDRESLVKLMHDYHEYLAGSDVNISYEELPPVLEVQAGIFAGYRSEVFRVNPAGELDGFNMDPASFPGIGFSLSSPLPRITRDLSLRLNISAANRYVYGYYVEEIMEPEITTFKELHLHHVILQADFLVSYSFGSGRMIPFICTGVTGQGIIRDDSRLDSDTVDEGIVISESNSFRLESKFRPGVLLGAGLSYNLYSSQSLFMRLDYSYLFGDNTFSSIRSAGISAGIIF